MEQCCEIIGCFVDPRHCLEVLMPFLPGGSSSAHEEQPAPLDHSKAAPTLAVLAALVMGAGPQVAVRRSVTLSR